MAALAVEETITTLVAEADDARAQRVLHALIDDGDLDVVAVAPSGEAAVAQVLELMPDSALVGLGLPDVDGLEVCKAVHHAAPATALVVLADPADQERAFVALCEGASACVHAGASEAEIAAAVRGATRGECVLPGPLAAMVLEALEAIAGSAAPHAAVGRPPAPTDTEREVLACLAQGESPQEIADRYEVTARLVNLHCGFAVAKLQRWTERRRQLVHLT